MALLCAGGDQIALLDASGGGTWTSSDGSASIDVNLGTVTPNTAGNPTITYSNGQGTGCQITTPLTINPAPAAITGMALLCAGGDQITLLDASGGGTWSSSDGSSSIAVKFRSVTPNTAGKPTITYSNGQGPGCQITTPLTINPAPAAITGMALLCAGGDQITLLNAAGGGTWTSSDGRRIKSGCKPGNSNSEYSR